MEPRRHEYKFVVNGEELIDPENDVFVSNNIGGWNSILDIVNLSHSFLFQIMKHNTKNSYSSSVLSTLSS